MMKSIVAYCLCCVYFCLFMACEVNSLPRGPLGTAVVVSSDNRIKKLKKNSHIFRKRNINEFFTPRKILINSNIIFNSIKPFDTHVNKHFLKPKHFEIKRCDEPFCYCKNPKFKCKKYFIRKDLDHGYKYFYIRIKVVVGCNDGTDCENNRNINESNDDCFEINNLKSADDYTISKYNENELNIKENSF